MCIFEARTFRKVAGNCTVTGEHSPGTKVTLSKKGTDQDTRELHKSSILRYTFLLQNRKAHHNQETKERRRATKKEANELHTSYSSGSRNEKKHKQQNKQTKRGAKQKADFSAASLIAYLFSFLFFLIINETNED